MQSIHACSLTAILLLGAAACGRMVQPAGNADAAPETAARVYYLDHAQPKLTTLRLFIGPHELNAEVARTTTEIATGMMFRRTMKESEGMLFVFPTSHRTAFYMKNTFLPLSCAYLDSDGKILEIHDLEPLNETPVEASSDQVRYVIEVKQGWFQRHQIGVGTMIVTDRGRLDKVFFWGR